MPRQDREPIHSLENDNLVQASPAVLMRDNPAALIVNRESYGRMAAHFSPLQFDPPQLVRVSTFSAEHGVVVKQFVLDGMTRTKFVQDNQAQIEQDHPDFQFKARDVTESALRNPAIMGRGNTASQDSLTMLQYLRAVIPPTVEHSQIAPDRIAAHLINGWENMVGEDLSKKYSALAALSLLANPGINTATDEALRRDLGKQQKLMSDETIEDRVRLQGSLVEMAQIVRESKLIKQEVARAAFTLVSAESPVIGGEKEARRQIFGLLHTPDVERKLTEAFSTIGEREQMRDQLGQFITDSFRRIGQAPNREEVLNVLGLALKDPSLSFNYVIDVFSAPQPITRYDEVREEVNTDRLTKTYLASFRAQALTPVESELISGLGRRTVLNEHELQGLTRAINSANSTHRKAEAAKTQFETQKDQLVAQGVSVSLLDEVGSRIQIATEAVTSASSLPALTRRTQELNDTLAEINRRIERQVTTHKVGEVIDALAGSKLSEGYGPQIRTDIIGLVMGEFGTLDDRNRHVVSRRVSELTSLDQDLLLRVKNGDIRLSLALQRQRDRASQQRANIQVLPTQPRVETPPASVVPTRPAQPRTPEAPAVPPVTTPVEAPTPRPSVPEQNSGVDDVVTQADLEERRKRINREKLTNLTSAVERALSDIDLQKEDFTPTEQQAVDSLVRRLGKLAYGHPDIVRVVTRDYPNLMEEARLAREAQAYNDTESAQRDARTGR